MVALNVLSPLIFQLAIGLVVALNYRNPFLSPYDEFQVCGFSLSMPFDGKYSACLSLRVIECYRDFNRGAFLKYPYLV